MKASEYEQQIEQVLRDAMHTGGIGARDVARVVGCSPARMYQWLKLPRNASRVLVVGRTSTGGQLLAMADGDDVQPATPLSSNAQIAWVQDGELVTGMGTVRWLHDAEGHRIAVLEGPIVQQAISLAS